MNEDFARKRLANPLGWPHRIPDLYWEILKQIESVQAFIGAHGLLGSAIIDCNQKLDDLEVIRPFRLVRQQESQLFKPVDGETVGGLIGKLGGILLAETTQQVHDILLHSGLDCSENCSPLKAVNWLIRLASQQQLNKDSECLTFGCADSPYFHEIPIVPEDETLNQLFNASKRSGEMMGWSQGEALAYLMCGVVPTWQFIKVQVESHSLIPRQTRILLSVDPLASPREVMERFSIERKKIFSGRDRSLSERKRGHLRRTYISNDFPISRDWQSMFEELVESEGASHYRDTARFKFEMKEGFDALIDPFEWDKGKWGRVAVGDVPTTVIKGEVGG